VSWIKKGEILMNLNALKFGYKPLELYRKEDESRNAYTENLKLADDRNSETLTDLIRKELTTF
jgi:cell filamentation protein